jgi:hypothetical protein
MDPRQDAQGLELTDVEDDEIEFDEDDLDDDEEVDDDEAELLQKDKGRDTERELDHGLKETFPASDPVSINPGAD